MKKLSLLFAFLPCLAWGQSTSPEVIGSAGDHFSNASAQLSWTIGEVVIDTYTAGNNTLTQGFHQTNLEVTSIEDPVSNIEISVYPNPALDQLNIQHEGTTEPLQIHLYDGAGKLVLSDRLINQVQSIDLTGYAAGLYLLNVSNSQEVVKTFKINKTH